MAPEGMEHRRRAVRWTGVPPGLGGRGRLRRHGRRANGGLHEQGRARSTVFSTTQREAGSGTTVGSVNVSAVPAEARQ